MPATDASASAGPPTSGPGSPGNPRIIKRYSNRKLYDTVESRYVTLPQIAVLVRRGDEVRIIDNNSKEDLTSVTLAQILYEEERRQSRALPLGALKDLLHTSSERLISTLREGPMGKFIPGTDSDGDAAPPAPAESAPPPAPEAAPQPATPSKSSFQEMLDQSRESLQEFQHRVDERVRTMYEKVSPAAQITALQAEIKKLQARIEALEGQSGGKRE